MHKLILIWFLSSFLTKTDKTNLPDSKRATTVRTSVWPKLQQDLAAQKFNKDLRVYIRIIKQNDLLEIWAKKGSKYELFKRYNICYYSGGPGTKIRSGDNKSPEGFYTIEAKQLNPSSNYHLAVNIGYPNRLEQLKGYTGNAIMIHGSCASIGCYAMTNPSIEEIYTLTYMALSAGQKKIDLAIFPFRMDDEHLKKFSTSPYYAFWKTLKPGYELFEKKHTPPNVGIEKMAYKFN